MRLNIYKKILYFIKKVLFDIFMHFFVIIISQKIKNIYINRKYLIVM